MVATCSPSRTRLMTGCRPETIQTAANPLVPQRYSSGTALMSTVATLRSGDLSSAPLLTSTA